MGPDGRQNLLSNAIDLLKANAAQERLEDHQSSVQRLQNSAAKS
jgi:hypothetical protein